MEARLEVKNKGTYVPKRIQIDINNKEEPAIVIAGTAQNDYGATKDISYLAHFSYDGKTGLYQHHSFIVNGEPLDEKEEQSLVNYAENVDFRQDKNCKHFSYGRVSINGSKYRMKGDVFVGDSYLIVVSKPYFGIETPVAKIPLFKKKVDDNKWESSFSSRGVSMVYKYDDTPGKYKSTEGVLTLDVQSLETIYYLVKEK